MIEEKVGKLLNSKKIAIFGWPASGKSTFGVFIKSKLNIELYSLDLIRWKYSNNGVKDDNKFLKEYNEILKKDEWIIEGNALDWIDSRLEEADMLLFFDSTIEECMKNYDNRENKIQSGKEERINFDTAKRSKDMKEWLENRYSKKIDKLRPRLDNYEDKLIAIHNYEELNDVINNVNSKI